MQILLVHVQSRKVLAIQQLTAEEYANGVQIGPPKSLVLLTNTYPISILWPFHNTTWQPSFFFESDPHLEAIGENGLAKPTLNVPNESQASCSGAVGPSGLEGHEHSDKIEPTVRMSVVRWSWYGQVESILPIIDGKSFVADKAGRAGERRLKEALNAICQRVFHKGVSVYLLADLGLE